MTPIRIFFNLRQDSPSDFYGQPERKQGYLFTFPFLLFISVLATCARFPVPDKKPVSGYFAIEEIPIRMGKSWEEIRHLELHSSSFSDQDMERLPPMPRLEFLSLGGTSVKNLDFLNKNKYPRLAVLYLENTPVDDESFRNWKTPPTITKLFLNRTRIRELRWIGKFPKLRHLSIHWTSVKSLEGIQACPDLVTIWLGWTGVDDLGLLFDRPSLQYVGIDNLWIRKKQLEDFRKSNPYAKLVLLMPIHF